MRLRALFLFAGSIAAEPWAAARSAEGLLDLLLAPHDGRPVLAAPGGSFALAASGPAAIRLLGEGTAVDLDARWTPTAGGLVEGRCEVPRDTAPGAYALEARAGDRTDVNVRSVFVFDAFPERYSFAQVTDIHIGSNRRARSSQDIFRDVLEAVNASGAAFALITGDLTENGEPAQFRDFVTVLNTCRLPTFVCPGNHDRAGRNYEAVFGTGVYRFEFGQDGYLAVDTKDYLPSDDLGTQPAELEGYRRAIKPDRWAVGFSHRYDPDMGMRAQLILFVDNPLDWFIFGHWHRANTPLEKSVPWTGWDGPTRITATPAAIDGAVRLFDIGPAGVKPRDVQIVVAVE